MTLENDKSSLITDTKFELPDDVLALTADFRYPHNRRLAIDLRQAEVRVLTTPVSGLVDPTARFGRQRFEGETQIRENITNFKPVTD